MDMQLVNRDTSAPNGYTNDDVFSVTDDLESYSSTEDPFSRSSKDPPALIACVVYLPDRARRMANLSVQCHGGYRERENDGKENCLFSPVLPTLTNPTAVRESSKRVLPKSREGPQVLHIRDSRVPGVHPRWPASHAR